MQVRPPWWPPDILGFQTCAAVKLQSTRSLDRLPLGPSWSSQLLHLLWVPFGCPAAGYFHSCLSSLWHLLVQHCLLPDPPSLPAHAAGGWAPLAWSPHWSGHRIWSLKAESGQLCNHPERAVRAFFSFSFDGLHVCLGRWRVLERSITGSPVPHTCPPCVPFSWTLPQSVTASPVPQQGCCLCIPALFSLLLRNQPTPSPLRDHSGMWPGCRPHSSHCATTLVYCHQCLPVWALFLHVAKPPSVKIKLCSTFAGKLQLLIHWDLNSSVGPQIP